MTAMTTPLDTLCHSRFFDPRLLNDEQRAAANDDSHRMIVVGAGAGTGKTQTLVARYLRLLLTEVERDEQQRLSQDDAAARAAGDRAEPASQAGKKRTVPASHPLDRILAITYTNAAADEMRARVEGALRELGFLSLARQMDRAWIMTFHGFCARVLRRHALDVGIDPGFRVLDDNDERARLQRRGFDMTRSELFSSDRAALMQLLRYFSQASLRSACFRLAAETAKVGVAIREVQAESFSPEDLGLGCPPLSVIKGFLRFADLWQQCYSALKQSDGAYDFDDLLLKCRAALDLPHIRESYRAQFTEALLDEAQDTNELELALFDNVAQRQFIVGDSKQSIYRFQGADVSVFGQLVERADDQAADPESIYHRLRRNYRSREEILREVNELFATDALLGKKLELLSVGDQERQCLPSEADYPQPVTTLCFDLGATSKGSPKLGDNKLKRQAADKEAEWIARQFSALVGQSRQTKDGPVPITPGDLVVLVAKRRFGKTIAAALKKQGLMPQIIGGDDYLEQPVVSDARALLAALRNPNDDDAFLRLLLSRLGRFSDRGLSELANAAHAADHTLWEATRENVTDQLSEPADAENLRQVIAMLADAFARLGAAPLSEIIARAFAQRDADECVLTAGADAAQSFADLQYLYRLADAVQESGGGLVDLIAYFDEKEELGGTFSSPLVSADAADVVRIMTIHASKGLQFPVVAVACAQDVDAVREPSESVFILAGAGPDFAPRLGLKYKPEGAGDALKTPTAQSVICADKDAEAFEKKRQLYVACTRAEQVLLLSYRRDARENSISGALASAFQQRASEGEG